MFFDYAYGTVLFLGEFSYVGKCLAKYIYIGLIELLFLILFGRCELASFQFEICKLQTSSFERGVECKNS